MTTLFLYLPSIRTGFVGVALVKLPRIALILDANVPLEFESRKDVLNAVQDLCGMPPELEMADKFIWIVLIYKVFILYYGFSVMMSEEIATGTLPPFRY